MSSWRTALRIAWRESRRAKGRAALVVAMIALPVAGTSFTAVVLDTFQLTPAEQAERIMGTSEAVLSWPYDSPVAQEPDRSFALPIGRADRQAEPTPDRLLALLPAGTRLLPNHTTRVDVRTAAGTGSLNARLVDYTDPLAAGILRPLTGRAPENDNEVVLTPEAAARIGSDVVRTVDGKELRVVGTVEAPDALDEALIVLRPGALPVGREGLAWLSTAPLTWSQVKTLNTSGVHAISRQVLADLPPNSERYRELGRDNEVGAEVLVLVAGLAVLEVVLLAGPALAVGARRRRRDLALVSAVGGTPAHVRRIVLADGVVLGAFAAFIGVVLGVLVAIGAIPLLERFDASRAGALRFSPTALVGLALLAVVTGVLAALVPAWLSSRQDVVTALAGKRGVVRSKRRWLVVGLVLVVLGAATMVVSALQEEMTVILAGLAVAELGLVLCTPALVGLVARLGRGFPVALRIALRDASRNRTAAAPAISAVMAVVIASLGVSVILNSQTAQETAEVAGNIGDVAVFRNDPGLGAIPATAATLLRENLPIAETHEIRLLSCDGGPCMAHVRPPAHRECPYSFDVLRREPTEAEQVSARADARCDDVGKEFRYFGGFMTPHGMVAVIDPSAAATVAGPGAEDALRAGKIVVSDPKLVENDRVLLSVGMGSAARVISAPGAATPERPRAPIAVLTQETARTLGFDSTPFTQYATTTRFPTVEEMDRLQAALGSDYEVRIEGGTQSDVRNALTVLALVAALITLAAAALATGLTAADGRADLTTLAAVGASPRLRRALSLSQSGVIAGLGSLLGTVVGLGASVAVLTAMNQRYADQWPVPTLYPITVPWPNVAVALLVVPLVAMLGAGLLSRSRLPIERRH